MINSQQYNHFAIIRKIVVREKRVYQNFINCDIEIARNFRDRQTQKANININLNSFVNDIENNNMTIMNNILFVIIDSNENFIVKSQACITTKATKIKNQKFIDLKFKKLLTLFNVHAKLYLNKITREYITIINLSVLTKKMKYI